MNIFKTILGFLIKENQEITELQKIKYDTYIKHREYLIREKHNMEDKDSKLLIYLSAGVLSFSVAFIENISYEGVVLLIISWILSISSLILILYSFVYSTKSFKTEIDIHDIEYENSIKKKQKIIPENDYVTRTKLAINSARVFLIFSIILLFIFYILNIFKNV